MKRKRGRPKGSKGKRKKQKKPTTLVNKCPYCQKDVKGNRGFLKVHMTNCSQRPLSELREQHAEKTNLINEPKVVSNEIQVESVEIKNIPEQLTEKEEQLMDKAIQEQLGGQPQPDTTIPEETVKHLLKTGGDMLSNVRKNDVWKFEEDEIKAISPLTKKVIDKYIPNFNLSDEAMLAITFGMIMVGKYQVDVAEKRRKEADKEEKKTEKTEKSHPLQTKENSEIAAETKKSLYGNQSKETKEETKTENAWLKNLKGNRS